MCGLVRKLRDMTYVEILRKSGSLMEFSWEVVVQETKSWNRHLNIKAFQSSLYIPKNHWKCYGKINIKCCSFTIRVMKESESEVTQLGRTLCDPMNCSLPGSSVHGIIQARTLEWVDFPFSRGSSWPRDQIQVSRTAGRFFSIWATREAP